MEIFRINNKTNEVIIRSNLNDKFEAENLENFQTPHIIQLHMHLQQMNISAHSRLHKLFYF